MMIEDPIVLLVDDSANDAKLMHAVFERAGFVEPLRTTQDAEETIAYLRGDGPYGDRVHFPLPTAVLLDLNMPRKNGFELLAWIRQQPALKRLQVFILSASSRPQDIERAYDLGATSYLVKPGNLDGLTHLAKSLVTWLKLTNFAPSADCYQDREFAMAGVDRAGADFSACQSAR
ncbi:MAG: response regulator [Opitutaceae bacterium]|nr:response regulator [Opitutaceae bacterium]